MIFNMEAKYERGHKMYLDKQKTVESQANAYFECRDGIVESVEYIDCGGNNPYGWTRLMVCTNSKAEVKTLIRQTQKMDGDLTEQVMDFDTDSWEFLKAIINGEEDVPGGKFELLRDF